MIFNFREYYRILKKYLSNPSMSDEDLCNNLFASLIKENKLMNRKNDVLFFDKGRVSRLINGRDDVPKSIRSTLDKSLTIKEIEYPFEDYIETIVFKGNIKYLHSDLKQYIDNSSNLEQKEKDVLDGCKETGHRRYIYSAFIFSLYKSNKTTNDDKVVWQNGSNKIFLHCGNIFDIKKLLTKKEKGIIVIPVNTSFDIHITRSYEINKKQLVSENTIHGYWLNMMYKSNLNEKELKMLIKASLKYQKIKPMSKNTYPIGTIAVISYKDYIYYLLAISDFDGNNKAHSSKSNLIKSIEKLIRYYDTNGQGSKMFIPLIGTGRSRVHLSFQDSYDLIKKTLIQNSEYINGKIYIVDRDGMVKEE